MEGIKYTTKTGKEGLRRINPETNELFKRGETTSDGSVFLGYDSNLKKDGYFVEKWKRPEGYIRPRKPKTDWKKYRGRYNYKYETTLFERTYKNKKAYCKRLNIPFNLTEDYLLRIYPENLLCPILNVEMTDVVERRGVTPENFATLDRVIPYNGYVEGNVQWISKKANRLKSDMDVETLQKILEYVEKNSS